MVNIPHEAVTAAAEAMPGLTREHAVHVATEALEAAAPHIAAAERERIVAVALRDIASFVAANEAGYTADLQPFVDLIRKGFPDAV